jgi:uncharacterized protein
MDGVSMRQYVRDRIRALFHHSDPPHKLAFAFALGIFIAFTPTIGLHLITCLVMAWALRLSKLVIITASFINNPWTVAPLYGFCFWFGIKVTGSNLTIPDIPWDTIGLGDILPILKPFLWPFIVGTLVIGTISAIFSYFLFYWGIMQYRKSEQKQ